MTRSEKPSANISLKRRIFLKVSGLLNVPILHMASQTDLIFKDKHFIEIYEQCKEYTETSIERMYALYLAVNYISKNRVQGDFVECGVWKGGKFNAGRFVSKTIKRHKQANIPL